MEESKYVNEDIFSKVLRAGRRTYFFDVRSTKAEITLQFQKARNLPMTTEHSTSKNKIYLYKEDFENFSNILSEMTKYIIDEKGEEDKRYT